MTPTSIDTLSISGDSTTGSVANEPLPRSTVRDITTVIERLERTRDNLKLGRRKRRRAHNGMKFSNYKFYPNILN